MDPDAIDTQEGGAPGALPTVEEIAGGRRGSAALAGATATGADAPEAPFVVAGLVERAPEPFAGRATEALMFRLFASAACGSADDSPLAGEFGD